MKKIMTPENKYVLMRLIKEEIELNGLKCTLNHIDVSNVIDMSFLFDNLNFNGNISEWNVKNVETMQSMFHTSKFNGDISKWDTESLQYMEKIFAYSHFTGDISQWDVRNVLNMEKAFINSSLNSDLSKWTPYSLLSCKDAFEKSKLLVPYWMQYDDINDRKKAIEEYIITTRYNNLNEKLEEQTHNVKRVKL